jgi:MoaD family protein
MKVRVELFAQAREVFGASGLALEVPRGSDLLMLLQDLAAQQPKASRFFFSEVGTISPSLAVAVNEKQVPSGTNPTLSDGDEILLIPPVSGG